MRTPNPAHNGLTLCSRLLQGHLVLDWQQPLDQAIETCTLLELWLDLVDPLSPCWCAMEARLRAGGHHN